MGYSLLRFCMTDREQDFPDGLKWNVENKMLSRLQARRWESQTKIMIVAWELKPLQVNDHVPIYDHRKISQQTAALRKAAPASYQVIIT